MVRFIAAQRTLELRSRELRNGLSPELCTFPTDEVDGAFHVGYFMEDKVVSVASFFPKNHPAGKGIGYQLRGMATDSDYTGKGYASKLLDFAVCQLNATNATYLWCNARLSALDFYKKNGFTVVSGQFEIPGIGPHYEMILNLHDLTYDGDS